MVNSDNGFELKHLLLPTYPTQSVVSRIEFAVLMAGHSRFNFYPYILVFSILYKRGEVKIELQMCREGKPASVFNKTKSKCFESEVLPTCMLLIQVGGLMNCTQFKLLHESTRIQSFDITEFQQKI